MDENMIESFKGKSREERMEFFNSNKEDILSLSISDLDSVNGGSGADLSNPNSEGVDGRGNYWTSWGYTCRGVEKC